ncbi:MAG: hypothetical protein P8M80_06275 [Pirellulaceae bacterium]|jgi:hypothetical protein|nr:hypothetical protein [Pirellulaceae bacterium]
MIDQTNSQSTPFNLNTPTKNHSDESRADFNDRRRGAGISPSGERRQFASTYDDLSVSAKELGEAVDQYKLLNRRRYVNYEELLVVIESLGYSR